MARFVDGAADRPGRADHARRVGQPRTAPSARANIARAEAAPARRARACPTSTRAPSCVDLSLVDPDNRRPVDYADRARAAGPPRRRRARPRPRRREAAGHLARPAAAARPRPSGSPAAEPRMPASPPRASTPWPSVAATTTGLQVVAVVTRLSDAPRGRRWLGRAPRVPARGGVARPAHRPRRGLASEGRPGVRLARLLADLPVALLVRHRTPWSAMTPPDRTRRLRPHRARPSGRPPPRASRSSSSLDGGRRSARAMERQTPVAAGGAAAPYPCAGRSPGTARIPRPGLRLPHRRRRPHARPARRPGSPQGVHGASRWFDASQHAWQDATWAGPQQGVGVLGAVVYELHVGTFTAEGTLDAAIERARPPRRPRRRRRRAHAGRRVAGPLELGLRRRRSLGGRRRLRRPGGPAAVRRRVPPPRASASASTSSTTTSGRSGNYLSPLRARTSPTRTTPRGATGSTSTAATAAHVRRWIVDNALRWFGDFHVDALRLDAVHELHDDSPRARARPARRRGRRARAARLGRPLAPDRRERPQRPAHGHADRATGGGGMDAQWDDDVHHALHVDADRRDAGLLRRLRGALPRAAGRRPAGGPGQDADPGFLHDGTWSSFRGSDWGAPGRPGRGVDGRRFLAYLQTHDQVGNRAVGDRICAARRRPGCRPTGAALYLTSAFTPMVFMGEEWAATTPFQFFTDFDDPELAHGRHRRPPSRVRVPRLGRRGRAGPAGRGDLPPLPAATGTSSTRRPRADARVVPRPDRAAAPASPRSTTAASTWSTSTSTRTRGGSWCAADALRIVAEPRRRPAGRSRSTPSRSSVVLAWEPDADQADAARPSTCRRAPPRSSASAECAVRSRLVVGAPGRSATASRS